MNLSIVRYFRGAVADKAITTSEQVRLRLAVAIVERKTKSIIETSSTALSGPASQQQLQMMVDAADRIRMRTAARFSVPAGAIGVRCDSLSLLRSLASAKQKPDTVILPVIVAAR